MPHGQYPVGPSQNILLYWRSMDHFNSTAIQQQHQLEGSLATFSDPIAQIGRYGWNFSDHWDPRNEDAIREVPRSQRTTPMLLLPGVFFSAAACHLRIKCMKCAGEYMYVDNPKLFTPLQICQLFRRVPWLCPNFSSNKRRKTLSL